MSTLKTLKDICHWIDLKCEFTSYNAYLGEDIQEAAREWVKEILKNLKKQSIYKYEQVIEALKRRDITYCYSLSDKYFYISDCEIADIVSKLGWIIHFFNLEEKKCYKLK